MGLDLSAHGEDLRRAILADEIDAAIRPIQDCVILIFDANDARAPGPTGGGITIFKKSIRCDP